MHPILSLNEGECTWESKICIVPGTFICVLIKLFNLNSIIVIIFSTSIEEELNKNMLYSAGIILNDLAKLEIIPSSRVQRNLFVFENMLLEQVNSRGETRSDESVAEIKYTFVIRAKVQVGNIIHEVNIFTSKNLQFFY